MHSCATRRAAGRSVTASFWKRPSRACSAMVVVVVAKRWQNIRGTTLRWWLPLIRRRSHRSAVSFVRYRGGGRSPGISAFLALVHQACVWLHALQLTMEQPEENIFVACTHLVHRPISTRHIEVNLFPTWVMHKCSQKLWSSLDFYNSSQKCSLKRIRKVKRRF